MQSLVSLDLPDDIQRPNVLMVVLQSITRYVKSNPKSGTSSVQNVLLGTQIASSKKPVSSFVGIMIDDLCTFFAEISLTTRKLYVESSSLLSMAYSSVNLYVV
jgi:hypothetical protein